MLYGLKRSESIETELFTTCHFLKEANVLGKNQKVKITNKMNNKVYGLVGDLKGDRIHRELPFMNEVCNGFCTSKSPKQL